VVVPLVVEDWKLVFGTLTGAKLLSMVDGETTALVSFVDDRTSIPGELTGGVVGTGSSHVASLIQLHMSMVVSNTVPAGQVSMSPLILPFKQ
jgi:hypothetical protein